MVRLPNEYQEVEYLESTGTQWIDTGIIPTTETVSQLKFLAPEYNGDVIYGFFNAEATDYRFFIHNGIFMFDLGGFRLQSTSDERRNKIYEIELGNYHIKDLVTNIFYASTTKKGVRATCTITLNNYKNTRFSKCRWYYVKIYEDTVLVRNFIPCYRKSDNEPGMYDTVSGTFYTNSGTGTFLVGNDVSWDTASLLERRRQILLNTPHIETVSGSMASFKTDISTNLKECKVYFSPVQEGTGDPSPDNVRPITGWDGIEVYHGKNMLVHRMNSVGKGLNYENVNENTIRIYGTKTTDSTGFDISKTFVPSSNTTLTFKGFPKYTGRGGGFLLWDATTSKIIGEKVKDGSEFTRSVTANHLYSIGIEIYAGQSIDMTFSPIVIDNSEVETLTIPFNRTIYGGYVDLLKGEVVEEKQYATLDGVNNQLLFATASNQYCACYSPFGGRGLENLPSGHSNGSGGTRYKQLICDTFPTEISAYNNECVQCDNNQNYIRLCLLLSRLGLTEQSTGTEVTNALNDWLSENPINICYTLATPNTYTLIPETIKALKGINNIWSNANGNIEISYYSH